MFCYILAIIQIHFQVDALMDDRQVKIEEFDTCRQRDQEKIKILTEKSVGICMISESQ